MEAQENKLEQALQLIKEVHEERPDSHRLIGVSRLTSILAVIRGDLAEAINEKWKEDTVNRIALARED